MKPKRSIKQQPKQNQKTPTRKNPTSQRLIKMMEKPPYLTDEDIEALRQSLVKSEKLRRNRENENQHNL